MNRLFGISILATLSLVIACSEQQNAPQQLTATPAVANAVIADTDENDAFEPSSNDRSPAIFLPPPPLIGSYGLGLGGGRRAKAHGSYNACKQVENHECDTGAIAPFDEGTINCENGQPVCRPVIQELSYYLYIEDFIKSFIEIPTSNVLVDSTTLSSKYLAGRAPVYDEADRKVGNCSASFLCMQDQNNIYTDISNYLSVDSGLIVSWFTPTTLINLELDNIVNSMVTECIVLSSTKILLNPFYGWSFNMIVSSDGEKIHFDLTRIVENKN